MEINIILIATKNKHKLEEIKDILKDLNIKVSSAYDYISNDFDIEETGQTFEENAILKAKIISEKVKFPVLADDSGLEVEALNGRPGVYSARFAGENATDEENNKKLLEEMKNIPDDKRNASFVCVMAFAYKGNILQTFRGECKGKIGFEPKGSNGFGYDPLFELSDGKKMAELSSEEKNFISHRRRALEILKSFLNQFDE